MPEFLNERDPQTSAIIAAAIEVHKALGPGFLEKVYHHALCLELRRRNVPYAREVGVPIFYRGELLPCSYQADLIVYRRVLVEVKAQTGLTEVDEAQVINYLKGTDFERAQLLNFGRPRLQIRRMILTADRKCPALEEPEMKELDPLEGPSA